MVDDFARVWPLVALEGVGDLIGDARPGLVAVDAGRRLGWANPAAATLFAEAVPFGAPLALDRRLADRIARFARRAAPGEEARELLRFVAADRPILRTVVFRRPIDADDAVIAVVDAAAAPELGTVAAGLAPFAGDGGLAALFDAEGNVLGAAGDLDIAEALVEHIESALAEADEIAVLERTLATPTSRHRLVLVRLGDRPDARRLLRLSPAENAVAPTPAPTPPSSPLPTPTAVATPLVDEAAEISAEPTRDSIDLAPAEPIDPAPAEPLAAADFTTDETDGEPAEAVAPWDFDDEPRMLLAPAPTEVDRPAVADPQAPAARLAETPSADGTFDEDRFVAAPPLALDLFTEADETEDDLDRAWRIEAETVDTTHATPQVSPSETTTEATSVAQVIETAIAVDTEAPGPAGSVPIVATSGEAPLPVVADSEASFAPPTTAIPADRPLAAAEEALPLVAHGDPDDDAIEASLPEPRPLSTVETLPEEPSEAAPIGRTETTDTDAAAFDPEAEAAALAAPSASHEAIAPEDWPIEAATETPALASDDFVFTPLERPVKFVWQMDADRRFTLVSGEFAGVVGPAAADLVGRPWDDVAARLGLDPDGAIGRALARRDTWSGRSVLWPVEGTATRIPVDLAALPAFDRGRTFVGFRGFGTCRTDAPSPDPRGVGLRLATPAIRTSDRTVAPASTPPESAAAADATSIEAEEPVAPAATPSDTSTTALETVTVAEAPIAESAPEAVTPDTPVAAAETPAVEPETTPPAFEDATTAAEQAEPMVPTDAPAVACVVETLAEPPLFPDDRESAEDEVDHPIEPAFAGDIGDDPLFDRRADGAATDTDDAVEAGPTATDVPASPESPQTPVMEVSEPAITPRPAPHLVALPEHGEATEDAQRLSVPERNAFRQIARALGARIEGELDDVPPPAPTLPIPSAHPRAATPTDAVVPRIDARLLDRLPLAVALLRDDALIHANERFLALLRYPDLATLRAAGGVDALFAGPHAARRFETADGRPMALIARDGTVVPCDARITPVPLDGGSGLLLTLSEHLATPTTATTAQTADHERVDELRAIVDTATDGVLMLDASGLVLSANAGAEALFGVERRAMIGRPLTDRLAPESHRSAMDYLDGLAANGVASVLNDGREVIGVVAPEGLIPLFMTIGRVSTGPVAKYCAVLRDITQWKKSEEELTAARRRAEEASIHKSDFLAKISHEIRTPLNAIIGFSELMLDERFGPVGSDRYKDYLRDIHVSGSHIMSLVNDLLDLSKVEAGKMDLRFEAVPLAEVVSECVALMQPQANRERIIIRSSLPAGVPPVVADPRSMRQVILNLLSNAVKFTPAGGQVIVSITLEDNGEVVLRVRDTGYGMSEKELQTALEPFRQLHTTRSRSGGTGLGLPLTKALTEANRAAFRIDSTVGQGTLVSVTFPVTRVLAG